MGTLRERAGKTQQKEQPSLPLEGWIRMTHARSVVLKGGAATSQKEAI
jgi:hypothetical protein